MISSTGHKHNKSVKSFSLLSLKYFIQLNISFFLVDMYERYMENTMVELANTSAAVAFSIEQ